MFSGAAENRHLVIVSGMPGACRSRHTNALSDRQALGDPIHPFGLCSRRIGTQGSTPRDELKGVCFGAELREERAVDARHEVVTL